MHTWREDIRMHTGSKAIVVAPNKKTVFRPCTSTITSGLTSTTCAFMQPCVVKCKRFSEIDYNNMCVLVHLQKVCRSLLKIEHVLSTRAIWTQPALHMDWLLGWFLLRQSLCVKPAIARQRAYSTLFYC